MPELFELSNDYQAALDYLDNGFCLDCRIEYIQDGEVITDIASAKLVDGTLIIGCRGTVYIWIVNLEGFHAFRKACVEQKVIFYLPVANLIVSRTTQTITPEQFKDSAERILRGKNDN